MRQGIEIAAKIGYALVSQIKHENRNSTISVVRPRKLNVPYHDYENNFTF